MKFGIHFGLWGTDYDRLGPETCLRQAERIGAEVYEFFPTEGMFMSDRLEILKLRKIVEELNIEPVFTFGYPYGWDMTSNEAEMRNKAVDHLSKAINGMGILGAKVIGGIVYANWPACYDHRVIEPEEKKRRLDLCVESLKKVMPVAEANDVTVCLEIVNRFEHFLINTVAEGVTLCKAVDSQNCKLLLDCFHMNIEEDDIPQAIRQAKGYIGHFHVSEPNRKVPYHNQRQNWPEIGKALHDTGYDKAVIVESVYRFGGESGHNMRIWRDLDGNTSLDNLLTVGKKGIGFIRSQFEKGE